MSKFKAPENIAELSNEDLAAALDSARETAGQYSDIDDAELTDEQAEEIIALGGFVTTANEELGSREAAAAERSEALASARAAMAVKVAKEEDDEVVVVEDGEPAADEDDEEPKRPFAAEAKQSLSSRAARNRTSAPKTPKAPERPRASLVAAADVKGVPAGQTFTGLADAAKAIKSRLDSLPKGTKNTRVQHGALEIRLPENAFSQEAFGRSGDSEMLMQAGSETRLAGKSLVAAGGWGAPSEMILDFCQQEDIGNLLQVPEVTVTRGGVQWTKGPTFADVFNSSTGFWDMTETTAEAGTELKTSIRPEIPDFTERRLDAVGVMMEAGLLTRAGWPELIARYASLALTAHQFKLSMKSLKLIEGYTGAAKKVTSGFGNALDVLHVMELVATGERQKNAMAIDATLEALVPFWLRSAIRAALANRHGMDFLAVTDAQIESYFAARKIKVQWINAYQNLELDENDIATEYPDTFEVIMYPAGTYVRGVADVITLDTIYDSTNLKKNDYVHLFVEQGVLMTNPCGVGQRLELPLNVNGRLAADDITKSFNGAVPTTP